MFCLEIKMPWCQNPSWRRKKTSCGDISTALNMTRHKIKSDWLLYLSVKWLLGQASDIQSGQGCQSFCNQSEGLATWDYIVFSNNEYPRWKKKRKKTYSYFLLLHIWKPFWKPHLKIFLFSDFHKNIKQLFSTLIHFLNTKINILELFLKDHTEALMLKIQLCIKYIKYITQIYYMKIVILQYINIQNIKILTNSDQINANLVSFFFLQNNLTFTDPPPVSTFEW